jgi:membrane-bound lytic murein transglycosylase B
MCRPFRCERTWEATRWPRMPAGESLITGNMKSRLFGPRRSLAAAAVIAASPAAASFSSCVAGLQEAAAKAGVSRSVASRALDIAQPDEKVLRLSEVQPEFKTPIWDYLGFLVDEQRVADGRAMMRQYGRRRCRSVVWPRPGVGPG